MHKFHPEFGKYTLSLIILNVKKKIESTSSSKIYSQNWRKTIIVTSFDTSRRRNAEWPWIRHLLPIVHQ
jgi:hypothetical protein